MLGVNASGEGIASACRKNEACGIPHHAVMGSWGLFIGKSVKKSSGTGLEH